MAFVAAALSLACTRSPAPPDASPAPSVAASAAPSRAASAEGSPPRWLGEGCHAGSGTTGSMSERHRRVSEACAPGSLPLGPTKTLKSGGEFRVDLPKTAGCARILAVAEDPTSDVTLELVDERGERQAVDTLPGSVALLGPRGPVCFAEGTTWTVRVGLARGSGDVQVSAHLMR